MHQEKVVQDKGIAVASVGTLDNASQKKITDNERDFEVVLNIDDEEKYPDEANENEWVGRDTEIPIYFKNKKRVDLKIIPKSQRDKPIINDKIDDEKIENEKGDGQIIWEEANENKVDGAAAISTNVEGDEKIRDDYDEDEFDGEIPVSPMSMTNAFKEPTRYRKKRHVSIFGRVCVFGWPLEGVLRPFGMGLEDS